MTQEKQRTAAGLAVKNLTVAYGSRTVLDNVAFTLPAGASLAIVGESGCGKTTLLTTVAGLLKPAAGTLTWTDVAGAPVSQVRSSFVWQNLGLFPWKTVEGNLRLPFELKNSPVSATEGALRASAMIEELGLTGLEKRWPSELSGGQRQALTLLMATLVTPKLLLLDEHTAALDPATAEKVLELTKSIVAEKKITCLMVTHNMHQALELGNRTLMMDGGRIVFDVKGEERSKMTVDDLLEKFRENAGKALDNDRILLSKVEAGN